jgi:hypothetical protein
MVYRFDLDVDAGLVEKAAHLKEMAEERQTASRKETPETMSGS